MVACFFGCSNYSIRYDYEVEGDYRTANSKEDVSKLPFKKHSNYTAQRGKRCGKK